MRGFTRFPPSVSLGVIAISGAQLDLHPLITEASLLSSMAIMLSLAPLVALRVHLDHSVAAGPAVAMLMAPASFVVLVWFSTGGSSHRLLPRDAHHLLFALSSGFFFVTVYSIWIRRDKIRWGAFGPDWVAFTFPLVSTATAALLYYQSLPPQDESTDFRKSVLRLYCGCLTAFTFAVVTTVNTRYFLHLSSWMTSTPTSSKKSKSPSRSIIVGGDHGGDLELKITRLRIAELKAELRARGAETKGVQAELRARLHSLIEEERAIVQRITEAVMKAGRERKSRAFVPVDSDMITMQRVVKLAKDAGYKAQAGRKNVILTM